MAEWLAPHVRSQGEEGGARWTLVALAKAAGVTRATLADMRDARREPEEWTVKKVAEALGVPAPSLWTKAARERYLGIVAEGGPTPSTVLAKEIHESAAQGRAKVVRMAERGDVYGLVTPSGDTPDPLVLELAQMIARDVGLAITRAVRQAHLDRSRVGLERLADSLLGLAVQFADNGDDNAEILRAVQRLRAVKLPG